MQACTSPLTRAFATSWILVMTPLEHKIQEVTRLLDANGLEVGDAPSPTRVAAVTAAALPLWSMRVVDPATNNDLFIGPAAGEYALWCEADGAIRSFIANGKVDADA